MPEPAPPAASSQDPATLVGTGVRSSVATPSSLRRAILVHLRTVGPTSPDALAAALGASRTGVLQQLHALEEARLVAHSIEKHGVGRPRHLYDVTPDAQDLFPADYHGFARGLLAAIQDVGGDDLVEQVLAARRRQIGVRIRERLDGNLGPDVSLREKVRALAAIQSGAGYLAEAVVGDDGAVRLREHNCAIFRLASESTTCCDAELALFRDLLGADVVRESHIASGDRSCTYRISERPEGPPA